jgi:hypothetical protein
MHESNEAFRVTLILPDASTPVLSVERTNIVLEAAFLKAHRIAVPLSPGVVSHVRDRIVEGGLDQMHSRRHYGGPRGRLTLGKSLRQQS